MGYNQGMTTLTLSVPDDLAARLATLPHEDVNAHAISALAQLAEQTEHADTDADADEARAWWNSLSEEERNAEQDRLARGLADIDAGRTRPAEKVYARLRAKSAA